MARRVHLRFISQSNYHFFIEQKAVELNLKGRCQRLQNNLIEMEVEGKTKAVDEFIKFIEKVAILQTHPNSFTIEIFNELKGYTTMKTNVV